MSKLDELIKELCPDGVEYRSLSDIFEQFSGMTGVSQKWADSGNCVFIDYLNTYNNLKIDTSALKNATVKNLNQKTLKQGDILLTCASETPDECAISSVIENEISDKVFLDDHLFGLRLKEDCKNTINTIFVNYLLHSKLLRKKIFKAVRGVTRFYISNPAFMKITIPVPPLEVQEEIVRILDTFTQLTAELTAELTERRRQYEYYRDALLTRETKAERKKLGEVFYTRNGYTPSTSNPDYWDNGKIPWFVMDDIRKNGRILSDSIQHVTESAVKKSGLFPANSIIVSTSATIGEHALITTDFLCNQRFTCLYPKPEYKNKINMKFMLYYAFKLDEFCKKNTTKSSFASVDMSRFYDFEIPLPPLDVQERLVRVLDNFDSICSDLNIGLPAEIEARKKQYEFYRDSLLTFAESGRIASDSGGGGIATA